MGKPIANLKICAFRQLKDVCLQQLGRVNLLVGVNNSGKTTVLEAISTFCRPLDPLEWISTARRREIKSSRERVLDAVRWLFPQEGADPQDAYYFGNVCTQGDGTFENRESRASYQGLLGDYDEDLGSSSGVSDEDYEEDEFEVSPSSGPSNGRRGAEIHLEAKYGSPTLFSDEPDHRDLSFRLWEDERYISRTAPSEPHVPVATVSPFSHRVEQIQVSQLTEATLSGTKFNALELVQLLDPDVTELEILSREGIRPTLYVQHRRTGFTPLSVLGDGVRRVLTFALNLLSVKRGVLLIDEIETAIHKDALGPVFRWLARAAAHHEVQVLATTQSLEAVDAAIQALRESLDDLVAFRLPAPKTPQTLARFSGATLFELRYENGLEVR
jgi:hypothetical protein